MREILPEAYNGKSRGPFISMFRNLINLPLAMIFPPLMILAAILALMMPRKLFRYFQVRGDEAEIASRLSAMKPYIESNDTALDVGAGSGNFSKRVANHFDAKVSGVDIIDYRDSDIEILFFDGKTLPFPDKSVDVAFAAFVLHHDKSHANLLKEMKRVARRKIIIFEDTFFTPWQRLFVCFNDFYSNIIIGSIKALKNVGKIGIVKMPLPFTFRAIPDWIDICEAAGFTITDVIARHDRVRPMSKVTIVLQH